ncbi:translation initiation factor IF-2 subunit gamma [Candidatus Pyrohabitans sp.]
MVQSEINIGLVGHVDHGKTTLTQALSGKWTDEHSEEIKRGISIRLGYANVSFRKCDKCDYYTTKKHCPRCGEETRFLREVSFVDSPGHETLMATMLSGAAIMDGAILVIAANEPCPQPQTKEHLMALEIIGIKNIVIAQNKIDIVKKERVLESYREIKEFVRGTVAENAPIIPVAAQHGANIDVLIRAIEEKIPTPKRDESKPPRMYIARSFDVNKPGTKPEELRGGVLGGSLIQGVLRVGDEIEIRPGYRTTEAGTTKWRELTSEVVSLHVGKKRVDEVRPGGLIGIGTKLDPSLTKADGLSGMVLGRPGTLPPTWHKFTLEVHLMERVVGAKEELKVEKIKTSEPLMLNVGTGTTVGTVTSARGDVAEMMLKIPVCAQQGDRVAISRRIGARWRLIGYGIIV